MSQIMGNKWVALFFVDKYTVRRGKTFYDNIEDMHAAHWDDRENIGFMGGERVLHLAEPAEKV